MNIAQTTHKQHAHSIQHITTIGQTSHKKDTKQPRSTRRRELGVNGQLRRKKGPTHLRRDAEGGAGEGEGLDAHRVVAGEVQGAAEHDEVTDGRDGALGAGAAGFNTQRRTHTGRDYTTSKCMCVCDVWKCLSVCVHACVYVWRCDFERCFVSMRSS